MNSYSKMILVGLVGTVLVGPIFPQVTQRVSVSSTGAQADHYSIYAPISHDGRYVAFMSYASNLVPGDTNAASDVFVRDRVSGTTERVSVNTSGVQGGGFSFFPAISADGRYVVFGSEAGNLATGDTNASHDIFLRDRQTATTTRVSINTGGFQANGDSRFSTVSADGRFIAFESVATNLIMGDTNGVQDIFLRDRQSNTTVRVSLDSAGIQGNADSQYPSISADGNYVTFTSDASNLVSGDTNGFGDVFVRDRIGGTTERVSVDSTGAEGDGASDSAERAISIDGRYVVFTSWATNFVPGDTNGSLDVFIRDRQAGTTNRVSVDSGGNQGNGSSFGGAISGEGRFVTFASDATNLVSGDTNGSKDVFLHDRQTGTTTRVSVSSSGTQANGASEAGPPSLDGRYVAFRSWSDNLVTGDTNLWSDIFIHDRNATGFTNVCDAGVGSVIPCPCSNPPGGTGRGCNNSSATGGAILTATGVAYLSMDSLVFSTTGERPTALSIVSQWIGGSGTGAVFGMGVRCTSGTFKRLYTKSASAGSITAPNVGAGDLPVSARSAATGDTILAGQNRWYLVFYRDPNVLGGCPSTSTFNATQTGQVAWSL